MVRGAGGSKVARRSVPEPETDSPDEGPLPQHINLEQGSASEESDGEESSGSDYELAGNSDEDSPGDDEAGSSDEDEGDEEAEDNDGEASSGDELDAALLDYVSAASDPQQQHQANGEAGELEGGGDEIAANGGDAAVTADPGSDSSEDERGPPRNTVGDVPLVWYKDEEHIGYDVRGEKLLRKAHGDKLDALLARNDSSKGWRTIYDDYNDEEIVLSKEEIRMLQRIRKGQFPHVEVNPYQPELDFFSRELEIHPLSSAPEPKRRFMPSKWEEKKIVRLVRALRKGWIKVDDKDKSAQDGPPMYLMWADDGQVADKTGSGLSYVPAPKQQLPGHEESYNPALEYLPTEEEKAAIQKAAEEEGERPALVPRCHASLRQVPAYESFIHERFERCLDLYLCPRQRRKRLQFEPKSLLPKLPKPSELKPYPNALFVRYEGHKGKVTCLAPDSTGQWLATGSADCTVKLWEVATGRCMHTWRFKSSVASVAWCPSPELRLLSAALDNKVVVWYPTGVGNVDAEAAAEKALRPLPEQQQQQQQQAAGSKPVAVWDLVPSSSGSGGTMLEITHNFPVKHVAWHGRGDYFASVSPTGNTQAVLVHQLSRRASQNPFRRNKGRVSRVAFHPVKPFFFVATQNHVRVYNLAKQALAKKLLAGSGGITCLAVHGTGDHLLVGCQDKRLLWFDLDLSMKPYKTLRYHDHALRGAAFHPKYPLFASAGDDAQVHVFHGMVYSDLLTNPLIVPLKTLRGHKAEDYSGVLDVAFHPTQPWVFSAGADGSACLFCDT